MKKNSNIWRGKQPKQSAQKTAGKKIKTTEQTYLTILVESQDMAKGALQLLGGVLKGLG